jgi:hypothetical protein
MPQVRPVMQIRRICVIETPFAGKSLAATQSVLMQFVVMRFLMTLL